MADFFLLLFFTYFGLPHFYIFPIPGLAHFLLFSNSYANAVTHAG